MGKPKGYKQTFLPVFLENSNFYSYKDSVFQKGYVISRYNNTGTLLVNRYDEKKVAHFENKFITTAWRVKFPDVMTLHENNVLQIINLEDLSCVQHDIRHEVVNEVQCILFDELRLYLISPRKLLAYDRTNWDLNPVEIELQSEGATQMYAIHEDMSGLLTRYRILIGGPQCFQVWQLDLISRQGSIDVLECGIVC